jgi:hypothetical protein
MGAVFYGLCAMTALLCSGLLLRAYYRSRYKLLLWGGLCFVGLTLNNVLLIVDRLLVPSVDLFTLRLFAALIAMMTLLYGVIWDAE